MNSTIDTPRPAELSRDSIAQRVTRFYDDVRADSILGPTFEAVLGGRWASRLPRRPAGFDLIASEMAHDGH